MTDARVRAAFVMEQTLGHVTHYQNLRAAAAQHAAIDPIWLPIPFEVRGPASLLPLVRSNWSVRASWRARRALGGRRGARQPDALVFHTQVTSLFSLGLIRRIPSVVSLDATPINYDTVAAYYNHRPAGDGLLDRRRFEMNRWVLQAAAGLVTWSEWARRSAIADYGADSARVHVLAPGANSAYFEIGQRRLLGGSSASPDGRVRVLFVGGDFHRKGGPLLLESVLGPLADRCEMHLVTQAAVAEDRPRVYVHRDVRPNSPELLRLFAAADVFVFPTRAECLAVALMEAAAAALPVITTNVGALAEAVEPGQSGLVIPTNDGAALGAALERLITDAALRVRMGRAGHALARRKFDARANNRAFLDLVVDLAQRQNPVRSAA